MPRSRTATILGAPLRGLKALANAVFPAVNPFTSWDPGASQVARKVGNGGQNSIVVASIGWLQRNFPQAMLRISEKAADGASWDPIIVGDKGAGRLLAVLEDPNPHYDWATMMKACIADAVLEGEFFWLTIRNGLGAPIEYWWAPVSMVTPCRREGSTEFLTHYEYRPGNGQTVILDPEDIVHHRDGIDPANPLRGFSRVKSVLREVMTDEEAALYTSTLLANMGVPGVVMSPDTSSSSGAQMNVSDEDLRATQAKVDATITGRNRGRTIVMKGATKLDVIGFNPQQMSLRDLRQVPEERITAAIGIPAIVAGMGAGLAKATFANFAEARETATEEALVPLFSDVARTIKKQVLPEFVGAAVARKLRVDFDLSEVRVLREDQDKIVDRMVKLGQAGFATRAQVKEKAGLPIEPSDNVYVMPMNVIEVPEGSSITSVLAPTDGTAKGMKAVAVASDEVKRLSQLQQARLMVRLEQQQQTLAGMFAKRLEPVFTDLGQVIADAWAVDGVEVKALDATMVKSERDEQIADARLSYAGVVANVMERANVAKWVKTRLQPAFEQHYSLVAEETVKTLGATIGLEIGGVDQVAVQAVAEGGTRAGLVNVSKQTETAIYEAIADGRARGLGPVDIERNIRSFVEGGPSRSVSARAMRIARTETRTAQSFSTRTSYKLSGAYDSVTAYDNRTGHNDADCIDRNGRTFDFDEADRQDGMEHPNGTLGWAPANTIG